MNIGTIQKSFSSMNLADYESAQKDRIETFYSRLSSAAERSETKEKEMGELLGLTMMPYNSTVSYGMAAYYSENSTESDPIIRVSSNYGGEGRYYNVHVNQVNPRNASQLEMFALSCYQDDKGITDGGTFGSFSRMKAYAANAAMNGYGIDLQKPEYVELKMDWVSMLKNMGQEYLQNAQTYSQYLDCKGLASALENWGKKFE